MEATPKLEYIRSGGVISTIFTFESPDVQAAANSVYVQKSTVDATYAAAQSNRVYTFKTDYERMQYIIGRQGTAPRASGY
jgi:hypothetical protein